MLIFLFWKIYNLVVSLFLVVLPADSFAGFYFPARCFWRCLPASIVFYGVGSFADLASLFLGVVARVVLLASIVLFGGSAGGIFVFQV
jgi:hypothetical protein